MIVLTRSMTRNVTRKVNRVLALATVAVLGLGLASSAQAAPPASGPSTAPSASATATATATAGTASTQPATTLKAAAGAPRPAGTYVALTPVRILDTRRSLGASGPVRAGRSITFPVLGRGGVLPSGVAAVALNITVTNPTIAGFVTAYADGSALPQTSNIDFSAGQTIANVVIVPVGADGNVRLFYGAGSGSVQIIADVAGFYVAGSPLVAGSFQALPPARVLDTRIGVGGPRASLQALNTRALTVAGVGGVPSTGVRAVAVNVTVTGPSANGFLTLFPNGSPRPTVSSVTFGPGQTVANLVIVPVSGSGQVVLFNGSTRPINAIADVVGYYLAGNPGAIGSLLVLPQTRLLDTVHGVGAPPKALGPNATFSLQVGGVGNIPTSGMIAVALNVTAVAPTRAGYVTVYPAGVPRPGVSHLDFGAQKSVTNLVIVPIRPDGRILLVNASGGATHLFVDLVGVYLDGTGAARCNAIGLDENGSLITRWNPLVSCMLLVLGQVQSSANITDVDTIIRYESSGDPNAINNYDINAQEGHPSEGLIQVIRPTFDVWRSPRLSGDLFNPPANLYAGLNYAINRYGSIHNVPGLVSLRAGGPYKGYILSK